MLQTSTDTELWDPVPVARRRRAAARRVAPTPTGWRDPLDRLALDRPRPMRRRPVVPFVFVDHDGNVRDESGDMVRSRLDVLLDAYPNSYRVGARTGAVRTSADAPGVRRSTGSILALQRAIARAGERAA